MNGREMEKLAWSEFETWITKWREEHPDDERDDYELSLIYPGKAIYVPDPPVSPC